MARKAKAKRKRTPKTILKLPDLEQSKSAVLNSLTSPSSQRSYDHAIREFIDWYCSEPRLSFNKTVVTRYRISLEQRHYAPSTINLRLAAVRRLAYEASDCGLLSPDLAAGIRRVKGARRTSAWLKCSQTADAERIACTEETQNTLNNEIPQVASPINELVRHSIFHPNSYADIRFLIAGVQADGSGTQPSIVRI
jgi:hypothetical protein